MTIPPQVAALAILTVLMGADAFSVIARQRSTNNVYVDRHLAFHGQRRRICSVWQAKRKNKTVEDDAVIVEEDGDFDEEEGVDWESLSAELLSEDPDDGLNTSEADWLPDMVKAKQQRGQAKMYAEKVIQTEATTTTTQQQQQQKKSHQDGKHRPSAYTDEEEEVIAAMGGKAPQGRREQGFLGDSTLQEIATDYSVPILYLADVLTMWGVPIPINVNNRLGDLVTGEQAFALVEAVNTLDVSSLHDRYSNTNLQQLCYEWDIDLQAAFQMAMKEGWSLPFGVQTCLRVEQEDELLRVLGNEAVLDMSRFEDDKYDE
jgi:hypothetical protein